MSEVIQRVNESWQGVRDIIAGIPDERMHDPGVVGNWSVKDILAHIAYWEDSLTERIGRRSPSGDVEPCSDVQETNERVYAERADWSLDQARAEMLAAHGRLLDALEATPNVDPDIVAADTWDHYPEHIDSIREWRAAQRL